MSGFRRRDLVAGTTLALALPSLGRTQTPGVKIGLVAVRTGPAASLGTHLRDGFLLGLKQLDGKLGGLPATVVDIDDELHFACWVVQIFKLQSADFIQEVLF
jgi:branched-chain amino acid transport system substrate-binding protein